MIAFDISKRFWVFEGSAYYPSGGMGDFTGSYGDLKTALINSDTGISARWVHILDSQTGEIAYSSVSEYWWKDVQSGYDGS